MDRSRLIDQLVKHEGLRLKPYVDTVGKVTIGVGHNLTDNGLPQHIVMELLEMDIDDAVKLLDPLPWYQSLDSVRQEVIVNMTFNLNRKILDFKNMIRAIQIGDWDEAANSILNSKFGKQVGNRAVDLATQMRLGTRK